MAFPTVPTVAGSRILFTLNTAGGGTKTFPNLSSLTKDAGDLLIAIIVEYDGNSTNAEFSSWGGSFTEFVDQAGTATMAIGAAYKWSTGSETGTFTVTTADTSANDSVMILMSIPGAHPTLPPEGGTMAVGTAPDAGSLNPAGWGTEDALWIAVGGSGEDSLTGSFTGIGTAPTNYTASQADSGITADAIGGVEASVGFRQLNAASEDPGAWSMDTSNARGAALLIAVRGITVQSIAAALDTTPVMADALTRETFVAVNLDTSPTLADALTRETFIASALDTTPILADNLTREAAIAAALDAGLAMAVNIDFTTPGGGAELFIAADVDITPALATALSRETFVAIQQDLSPTIAAALGRETFLAAALNASPSLAVALGREVLLQAALNASVNLSEALQMTLFEKVDFPIALTVTVNLGSSTPGGGGSNVSKYRTLLGAG